LTERRRLVRVPGSSANLGPGYDVFAAALSVFLELEVLETGEFSVEAPGLDVPLDRSNLCVRAFEELRSADGLQFKIQSAIPVAGGVGSSAAAIVAGLFAAEHLYELALERDELLRMAAEIEGHPDNVAAAIYGGVTICATDGDRPVVTRLDAPAGIEAVLVIPSEQVPTGEARAAMPGEVSLADAVANIAAASQLVLGLERADLNLIARGLADRLHQPPRSKLYPKSIELIESATELGAIGATISGAGPTVLVWTNWQETGQVVEALRKRAEGWAEVKRVPFSPLGADVPEL
jgi:homoserine kinase